MSEKPQKSGSGGEDTGKKVQVKFDAGALRVIDNLQRATGKNVADVIREALGFYDWARREVEAGNTIGTIKDGRPVRELLLPFEWQSGPKKKTAS